MPRQPSTGDADDPQQTGAATGRRNRTGTISAMTTVTTSPHGTITAGPVTYHVIVDSMGDPTGRFHLDPDCEAFAHRSVDRPVNATAYQYPAELFFDYATELLCRNCALAPALIDLFRTERHRDGQRLFPVTFNGQSSAWERKGPLSQRASERIELIADHTGLATCPTPAGTGAYGNVTQLVAEILGNNLRTMPVPNLDEATPEVMAIYWASCINDPPTGPTERYVTQLRERWELALSVT